MKLAYLIFFTIILTGCVKNGIAPVSAAATKPATTSVKTDSVKVKATPDTATTDIYNGTKGSAIIQVVCDKCTAIAIINNVGVPFDFNDQGVGQLKYTPVTGLSVYVAVCPNGVKPMKVDILDAKQTALFSYAGTTGNWSNTYVVK